MAHADRAEIKLRLWPLLRGNVIIPEARLSCAELLLENAPEKGALGNWVFLRNSSSPSHIDLQRLLIQKVHCTLPIVRAKPVSRLHWKAECDPRMQARSPLKRKAKDNGVAPLFRSRGVANRY